jgi:TolB-like protein/Tfp pilus assembly protein PilF
VADYSRLMGVDEKGTLAQLKAHRCALVDPKMEEHRGQIIKTTGAGMLIEFASVVDAVRCSIEVQRGMAERNASVPVDRRIEFRVGIDLSDIIHDERDVFGDGANVAVRLEALAEPGGICVSQSVHDALQQKLGFTFEDIGEQPLKNIADPIHTYRVSFGGDSPDRSGGLGPTPRRLTFAAGWAVGLAAACVVLAAVLLVVWPRRAPPVPARPLAAAVTASLRLPDKPSVAVLPFTSIGGDAKQERLADGITEDVITDLSRYRDLFVIARNSVFTYKGKLVNIQHVARELGVRYVLQGSIQTNGDRVRVTAQLIDATTGAHVWSERYDRPLNDIFQVQSEVTGEIAAALGGTSGALTVADVAAVRRKPPASLQAYDYYVLGQELHYRLSREDSPKGEEPLKKAIELDPQFARAYVALGHLYNSEASWGWGHEDPATLFAKAKVTLLKAIALDPTDALPHAVLGLVYISISEYDRGFAELERGYTLNPNDADVLVHYGGMLYIKGRSREGVEMMNRAFRLNPHYPSWYNNFADPYYAVGQYDQVIALLRRMEGEVPLWPQMLLAMSYAQLGRQSETAIAVAELRRRYPDFSMERMFSDFGGIEDQPTLAHYLEGARKAGLNECATRAELKKYPKMMRLALCDTKRA